MQTYRRNQAMRSWGHQLPTDRVPIEDTYKLIWEAHNDRDLSFAQISRLCDVNRETVRFIYSGKRVQDFITREVADKIALGLAGVSRGTDKGKIDTSLVDVQKHAWKIYGLFAQGWTAKMLCEILAKNGRPAGWVHHFYERRNIEVRTVKQLDWLVEVIGDRHGPSLENKRRMERRGFFPLIHYSEGGQLLVRSLTPPQKAAYRRLQSKHGGRPPGGDHGSGLRP